MDPFKSYKTASGKSIQRLLNDYGGWAQAALGRELYLEGQGIIAQSVPLVPVDTGTLRSSAYVEPPVVDGPVIRVTLGYGGPAAKINPKTGESAASYAIFVHENLEAHHKVGIAKYLEIPFDMAKRGMTKRIAEGMRRTLKGVYTLDSIVPQSGMAEGEAAAETAAKAIGDS